MSPNLVILPFSVATPNAHQKQMLLVMNFNKQANLQRIFTIFPGILKSVVQDLNLCLIEMKPQRNNNFIGLVIYRFRCTEIATKANLQIVKEVKS